MVYLAVFAGVALGYAAGVLFAPAKTARAALVNRAGLALLGGLLAWFSASVATPSGPVSWGPDVRQIQGRAAFDALKEESKTSPILVEFYADWCPPCRAQAPDLTRLAQEGHNIAVVNGETNLALMQHLGVNAYPTTIILKHGDVAHRSLGYKDIDELRALLR